MTRTEGEGRRSPGGPGAVEAGKPVSVFDAVLVREGRRFIEVLFDAPVIEEGLGDVLSRPRGGGRCLLGTSRPGHGGARTQREAARPHGGAALRPGDPGSPPRGGPDPLHRRSPAARGGGSSRREIPGGSGRGDPRRSGRRLFSPESAGIVSKLLTGVERPDLPGSWDLAREAPAVSWKTGTSFGHRDAWAAGTANGMTIGIWLGNFDGRPVKGISGSAQAGPVLMDLFRAVGGPRERVEPASWSRLRTRPVELCALSHERPGPMCPRRIRGTAIEGRTRLPECSQHRRVFVDEAGRSDAITYDVEE